jgi:hypothetical protein
MSVGWFRPTYFMLCPTSEHTLEAFWGLSSWLKPFHRSYLWQSYKLLTHYFN